MLQLTLGDGLHQTRIKVAANFVEDGSDFSALEPIGPGCGFPKFVLLCNQYLTLAGRTPLIIGDQLPEAKKKLNAAFAEPVVLSAALRFNEDTNSMYVPVLDGGGNQ